MTGPCALKFTFSDGEEVHVACGEADTLFEAAKQSGVALAHDCLNGSCGTCRGTLKEGIVNYEIEAEHLAFPSGEDDAVLACQARPTSQAVAVTFPYSRASLLPEKKRKLRILSKARISETVWDIRCKPEGLRMFDFLPGQYVRVTPVGQDFTRAYSPYTIPGSSEVGFLIRELTVGAMSSYLRDHPVKDDVWAVSGPYGIFYRRHTHAPSLYIAGGTGIAPVLSMLQAQTKLGTLTGAKKVIFGVTRPQDLFYVNELNLLAKETPDLSVVITVMEGSPDPSVLKCSVVDALTEADFIALGEQGAAYLCGPPAMIDAVRDRASKWSAPLHRIFAEEFLPS